MAKIHKFQGDITKEIANSIKDSIAILSFICETISLGKSFENLLIFIYLF